MSSDSNQLRSSISTRYPAAERSSYVIEEGFMMDTARQPQSRLRVGLDILPAERAMDGQTPGWSDLMDLACAAEDVGFGSIWVPDHFIFPVSPDEQCGTWECWSLLTALAVATSRIEIGSLVLGSGYRNPALLAKMADTVDEISGGRLILGLGSGWLESEYRAFGYPYDNLVSRFEEAVQIIRGLLKTGEIDFSGRFYQARNCELRPRGPRPDGPPIMIGSRSPRMHQLAARYGDWWNGSWTTSAEQFRPKMDEIEDACRAVERDPMTLVRTAGVIVFLPADSTQSPPNAFWEAMKRMGGADPLTGSPEEITSELLKYHAQGVEHIQLIVHPMTASSVHRLAPMLEAIHSSTAV
jgi:alkanesulfonate monooxygenase SsuD/methylene tetrahydromethanopterin reductase-like flavin-dependent oxidoreductase (luciferase family)